MTALADLESRSRVIAAVRSFFSSRGFVEHDTPLLTPAFLPEETIDLLQTWPSAGGGQPCYLLPSSEFFLKSLLAQGAGSLFQISPAFRDGEQMSQDHGVEFTMLEWYSVGIDDLGNIEVMKELAQSVLSVSKVQWTPKKWPTLSLNDLFQQTFGVSLSTLCDDQKRLEELCREKGADLSSGESFEELFNYLFLTFIEPGLRRYEGVFVVDYPAAEVTTASLREQDHHFSARWELYIGGREVANCFTEERDKERLRDFVKGEIEGKKRRGAPFAVSSSWIENWSNMPLVSGGAMGLDRFIMLLLGKKSIHEVRASLPQIKDIDFKN